MSPVVEEIIPARLLKQRCALQSNADIQVYSGTECRLRSLLGVDKNRMEYCSKTRRPIVLKFDKLLAK